MRIDGVDGFTSAQIIDELKRGGRFVFFEYCISCIAFTLRRPSVICFVPGNRWGWVRGLPYSLTTLALGWWGVPWGIFYTPLVLATNLAGGCDVTQATCRVLGIEEVA